MRATSQGDAHQTWNGINALLARVQAGDESAWPAFFSLVHPWLQRLAEKLLRPDWPFHSASDLTQNTWANVTGAIGSFQGSVDDSGTTARLRAWLRRIMTNLQKNERRSAAADRRIPVAALRPLGVGPDDSTLHPGQGDVPGREPRPSANLHRQDVHQAVDHLDATQREIIRRFFFEEQSLSAIARQLELSYDHVREQYHHALEQLRPHLDNLP
jgi:RNA polymerase sigma factor (sigma-70 family)